MNGSFYTAALGVGTHQMRLNVLSNNIANINTNAYKSKTSAFTDLMYYEMGKKADPNNRLITGTGVRLEETGTDFMDGGLSKTNGVYDYAIKGDGLFMLRDPQTQEITYSRDGSFSLSQRGNDFYLINSNGKLVLDRAQNPILVTEDSPQKLDIGIYDFANKNGMISNGENEFTPAQKNGNPFLAVDAALEQGQLESSNVDYAKELTKVMESQRAYSYALSMVKTSDEIDGTINELRR